MPSIVHREYECIISHNSSSMLYLRSVGICDSHRPSIGVSTMEAESQKRAPQKNEKQRACPVERRAVDVVRRGPERPEELLIV